MREAKSGKLNASNIPQYVVLVFLFLILSRIRTIQRPVCIGNQWLRALVGPFNKGKHACNHVEFKTVPEDISGCVLVLGANTLRNRPCVRCIRYAVLDEKRIHAFL